MSLNKRLAQNKTAMLKRWFDLVAKTYPPDTAFFLKSQKDPFANPVGRTIRRGLEGMWDELLGDMNTEIIRSFLDPMIRIRAVQDYTPSQATAIIFSLKSVIRESMLKELQGKDSFEDLLALEARIDQIGLIAFDIFMACREKIYEIKANEFRNTHYNAFKRAGLIYESPAE